LVGSPKALGGKNFFHILRAQASTNSEKIQIPKAGIINEEP
jgi:hypothetical protein